MRQSLLLIFLSTAIGCVNNEQVQNTEPVLTLEQKFESVLTLAIEKNLKYRRFSKLCSSFITGSSYTVSNVFTLPINKEIIDAAADLKCLREKIPDSTRQKLKDKSYLNFLRPNRISCVLMTINNDIGTVQFKDFKNNISLQIENGVKLPLADFTPTLAKELSFGFNAGYVYFNGTIPDSVNSYAIDFSNITLNCGTDLGSESKTFAFSFDMSQLNFLALIEGGMSSEKIREKYGLRPYKEAGISVDDFSKVVNFILTIFKAVKEISVIIA